MGEQLHVKDLTPDPQQVRRHTPRNLALIGDSLQAVGAARSLVLDENNVILAGNGTVEAAAERGMTKVRVIEADGTELIAIRRRGLTDRQKVQLALYDNRSADLAGYDLAALVKVTDTVGLGRADFFTQPEFRALEDREIANDLTGNITRQPKHETVPSIPEGYTAFSLVLSREAAEEIRIELEHVKQQVGVKTLAEALVVIVRAFALSRQPQTAVVADDTPAVVACDCADPDVIAEMSE